MAAGTAKLPLSRKSPEHYDALARVREWTRERFKLAGTDAILVTEIACGLPGCPPRETVVAFWTEDAGRHQFIQAGGGGNKRRPPVCMAEGLAFGP
jgi:hypothetical protein